MRRLIVFSFVFMQWFALSAQTSLNAGRITAENYYEEIPFEYENRFIIIEVLYRGNTEKFLFDTGAANVLFGESSVSASGTSVKLRDSNNNQVQAGMITAQQFRIGSLDFDGMTFIHYPEENILSKCFGVKGIIGPNSFAKSAVQIDFGRKLIIVTNDRSKLDLSRHNLFRMNSKSRQLLPFVYFGHQGSGSVEVNYLLDSGFSGAVYLAEADRKKLQKKDAIAETETGRGTVAYSLFGQNDDQNLMRVRLKNPLTFAGLSRHDDYVFISKDNDSKIGNEIMEKLNPIFDFERKEVYLLATPQQMYAEKRNIATVADGKKLKIASLWGALLKTASVGDEVVALDQVKVLPMDLCTSLKNRDGLFARVKLIRAVNQKTGKTYELSIR